MQLLIHGGFHKTGTTAFQKSTFLKLHELSDGGIIYNPPDLYNILTDKWKRDVFSYSESELAKVKKFFDRCDRPSRRYSITLKGDVVVFLAREG